MENEPEVIRQQMSDTRASLQDKLETLEQQVTGTVQGAAAAANDTVQSVKEAVQETVESVKESVEDTVESVKDTFDLRKQVEAHPWGMVIGAALVGYAGTRLLVPSGSPPQSPPGATERVPGGQVGGKTKPHHNGAGTSRERVEHQGVLSNLAERYADEVTKLQGLAIGAVGAVVREMLTAWVAPAFVEQISDVVDSVTVKLGGKTVQGPVFKVPVSSPPPSPSWQSRNDRSNRVEPLTP